MQGNEGKMIVQELKGIRKEISEVAREIYLCRQQEKEKNPKPGLNIAVLEDGKPKYAELNGKYYRLESVEKPPPGVAPGNRKASTGEGPILPSLR